MTHMSDRAELMQQFMASGRAMSTAMILFHNIVAEKMGVSTTESKALDLIERYGPLTAGELSERSGLAPASVTGLVDRLERKGMASRVRHPVDKRRVLVQVNPAGLANIAPLWADWVQTLETLCAEYTDEQLAIIVDFCFKVAERQTEAAGRLMSVAG